jgi:hypothetical protein
MTRRVLIKNVIKSWLGEGPLRKMLGRKEDMSGCCDDG